MSFQRPYLAVALTVWGLLLAAGFGGLFTYANTAGPAARPMKQWPAASALSRQEGFSQLVLFAHPRCPCSRASLGELERLLPFFRGNANVTVVFVKPSGMAESWAREDLWLEASGLPGVNVVLDKGGMEAERFGAKTSGQVFFFDPHGELIFQGGITPARGHVGDSDGRDAILAFVENGRRSPASVTPVFGCSLAKPERAISPKTRDADAKQ